MCGCLWCVWCACAWRWGQARAWAAGRGMRRASRARPGEGPRTGGERGDAHIEPPSSDERIRVMRGACRATCETERTAVEKIRTIPIPGMDPETRDHYRTPRGGAACVGRNAEARTPLPVCSASAPPRVRGAGRAVPRRREGRCWWPAPERSTMSKAHCGISWEPNGIFPTVPQMAALGCPRDLVRPARPMNRALLVFKAARARAARGPVRFRFR